MSLAALQRDFRAWIADDCPAAAARIGEAARPGLLVYQNNYRAQLIACLSETFERVQLWLGEEAFRVAAATHVDRVPPAGWTLDAYGADFPATLAAIYPDDPEVAELAWLDRALATAFAGPDAPPLAPDGLNGIDWDSAVMALVPTFACRPIATNAPAIWSALSAGEMPPVAQHLAEPASLIVWRNGFVPCFRTVDAAEALALAQIAGGVAFAGICALLVDRCGPEVGIRLAGASLGRWIGDGLIASIG